MSTKWRDPSKEPGYQEWFDRVEKQQTEANAKYAMARAYQAGRDSNAPGPLMKLAEQDSRVMAWIVANIRKYYAPTLDGTVTVYWFTLPSTDLADPTLPILALLGGDLPSTQESDQKPVKAKETGKDEIIEGMGKELVWQNDQRQGWVANWKVEKARAELLKAELDVANDLLAKVSASEHHLRMELALTRIQLQRHTVKDSDEGRESDEAT